MKIDQILLILVVICLTGLAILSVYYGKSFAGVVFALCIIIAVKAIKSCK
jgi:hypothetical protein